ncbi:MAG: DegT/DnrJ/EryC1/StrS family aminotransferase [Candidatus Pacebacteria bacterium]|nr:DegT/DnrJ/EryC1/StrS family aminotransferase [Candidatus Paceibacterota bacterium]
MQKKKEIIQKKINNLVKEYFSLPKEEIVSNKLKIPLNIPTFGADEVNEAIDSLLSTYVTMNEKVYKFEEMFASYLGVKYAVMVNSGSSANLIALSVLSNPITKNHIKPGDEVIIPAVTWSTTAFPIINIGAVPVLVDINLNNFNINADLIEKAITKKTKAIMPVHLLGNPANMPKILKIAKKHNLFVIEDSCESHGAEISGKKVGTFGDMGTFSFFFSHHISTMEGGMVVTNNEKYAELAKTLRAHGWIRELKDRGKIAKKYPKFDKSYLFVNMGYNLRPTALQGGFGIHQIGKLENIIKIRRKNADFWINKLSKYNKYLILPEKKEKTGERRVWFGFPLIIKETSGFSTKEMTDFLRQKGIENRPIMAGNLDEQPGMKLFKYKVSGNLKNSEFVMDSAFFFANHQGIGDKERRYVVDCIDKFFKSK